MFVGNFINHPILVGPFGRSRVQEVARRLRETGLIQPHQELTAASAAALLFGLKIGGIPELVNAISNHRKAVNDVIEALADLLGNPEKLEKVKTLWLFDAAVKIVYPDGEVVSGKIPSAEIFAPTYFSGDWVRLYCRATTDDNFLNDSF